MSKFTYDFNPLLKKVQNDVSFLCYLGLHQYAKENNLIGRSRPMIRKDLDFVKQKRLNFRLMVACIQQIIGSKTMRHGNIVEQINYVNVQQYSTMRLYGLIDKEMFAVYTEKDKCYTGYWPQQVDARDIDMLRSPAPLDTFLNDLGYNTRAMLEVGGDIFTKKLRRAVRFLPRDLDGATIHQQRDPKNRMTVKSLGIQMKLIESKHYRNYNRRTDRAAGFTRAIGNMHEMFNVPIHIEQLLNFRHVVWPWILQLQQDDAREALMYVAKNFPSVHAVQMKMRSIRDSRAEQTRLANLRREQEEQRAEDRQALRDRLLAIYGDRQRTGPDTAATPEEHQVEMAAGGDHINTELITGRRPDRIIVDDLEADAILPLPDVHHGHIHIDYNEDLTERVRRALDDVRQGAFGDGEDNEDDPEIPF